MNRIISKEEEREDPRRELQSSFQLESKSVSIHSTRNPASFQSSRAKTTILHTELILLQEILQLQGSSRADQYKASSSNCSRVSKHSTWQNKAPSSPYTPCGTGRLPVILGGRNSILSGSQHPRSPYSSSQANSIGIHLVLQNSTRRNRIHFKRVKYCISMQY